MKKLLLMASCAALPAFAGIRMGAPFADGAVLQRGMKVPVWGKIVPDKEAPHASGAAGCRVKVEFAGQAKIADVGKDGTWRVFLDPLEASKESRTMTVSEMEPGFIFDSVRETAEVKDVLVGEVWLASGQSNMECPIWGSCPRYRDKKGGFMTAMTRLPDVRYVKCERKWSAEPIELSARWRKFMPEDLRHFNQIATRIGGGDSEEVSLSAVAFYYARELYLALDVPIGMIDASWGGSGIDPWIPCCGYDGCSASIGKRHTPGMYNGMVAAFAPMAARGMIWYQGCTNWFQKDWDVYCDKLHALYNGWSREFANPDLKLYLVQLAPWKQSWIEICMAQTKFCAEEKNAALAVTADAGNFHDIHPNDKEIVARRLVLHALKRDYGFDIPEDDSPVLKSISFDGGKAKLVFDHVKDWYVYAPDYSRSPAFELAGEDGVWHPAKIVNYRKRKNDEGKETDTDFIDGPEIVLSGDEVANPVKVRYMGKPLVSGTLYNEASLPLGPFESTSGCDPADSAGGGAYALPLWDDFTNPPDSAKPWCYYLWQNGLADRETITADLEAMKRLGFGGINMLDTRGYWDDEEHVVVPKAEIAWGSPEWYDLVEFCIRECARLGLEFTMNVAASGGSMISYIDGKPYEADVLDRNDITAHMERVFGPILKRVPDLVGKTFTHVYSVSYEGSVKTGGSWKTIKDNFYATMREWAHEHGLKVYSESGGPWAAGATAAKLDCDQLDLLAHNDFPQGEFWPVYEKFHFPGGGHANTGGRFFLRGVVLSARREGHGIVSMEAFTHMHCHYSPDPALLKPLADIAFADGANRLVWHTFTSSPKKFGVPGAEYFAGTHINRNVTWHKDADAFVKYMGRCQALLQRGEYVDDGEFENVATDYYSWGRYRKDPNAQFTAIHRREGDVDWFFVAGEGRNVIPFNASMEGRTVEIWDPVTATRRTDVITEKLEDGKTNVWLDLPVGGSCFVVFAPSFSRPSCPLRPSCHSIMLTNAWQVAFAYMDGVSAAPPAPVTMPLLRDWTTYGEAGDAASTSLRYFSGTATYKTTVTLNSQLSALNSQLALGKLSSGLAHVFVNGIDCGVVWCAPWEATVPPDALRAGENEIEIRYTNNWFNRLVGDCFLKPEERVTRTNFRYWKRSRKWKRQPVDPGLEKECPSRPSRFSGPSADDELQPSGLIGPVTLKLYCGQ